MNHIDNLHKNCALIRLMLIYNNDYMTTFMDIVQNDYLKKLRKHYVSPIVLITGKRIFAECKYYDY